ncbi:Thiamine-monophosphate kinase [hydrothermal vent metagenome]|uniref:Thiamine-monophosphate kinase n=1 Tax=hydrothermal vent metagenome TaxID=652676 RepID=A0A3B1C9F4_9ZZZZ
MDSIKEIDLINLIEKMFDEPAPGLALGIGDDCAAIRPKAGFETLITTDTMVEGTHFKRESTTPDSLGRKSVCVSLSDISAMGGCPKFLLLSINISKDVDKRWIVKYLRGFKAMTKRYDCQLIGGNITRSRNLSLTVTALGEVSKGFRIDRSGARTGDLVYVTGSPGDSALGLDLLNRRKLSYTKQERRLIVRHQKPEARVEWGQILSSGRIASSMIDISDGVAIDLKRVLKASCVGAVVELSRFPLSTEAKKIIKANGAKAWRRILSGGEDYELLFTAPPAKLKTLDRLIKSGAIKAVRIGGIVKGKGHLTIIKPEGGELKIKKEGWLHNQQ